MPELSYVERKFFEELFKRTSHELGKPLALLDEPDNPPDPNVLAGPTG